MDLAQMLLQKEQERQDALEVEELRTAALDLLGMKVTGLTKEQYQRAKNFILYEANYTVRL